jgi:hypothetical protein
MNENIESIAEKFTYEFRSLLLKYFERLHKNKDDELDDEGKIVFTKIMAVIITETIVSFYLIDDEYLKRPDYFRSLMKLTFCESVETMDFDVVNRETNRNKNNNNNKNNI